MTVECFLRGSAVYCKLEANRKQLLSQYRVSQLVYGMAKNGNLDTRQFGFTGESDYM